MFILDYSDFSMLLDVWKNILTGVDINNGSITDAGKELIRFSDQLEKTNGRF